MRLKDTDSQMMRHRGRGLGVSGGQDLPPLELGLCPRSRKLSEPGSLWVLMEASSHRHSHDAS